MVNKPKAIEVRTALAIDAAGGGGDRTVERLGLRHRPAPGHGVFKVTGKVVEVLVEGVEG